MSITLLSGDNALEIEEALHAVRRRFDSVDILSFDGATVPLPTLSEACRTAGLFSSERLVVAQGLHERLKGARKEGGSAQVRELLESVAPTTTLLLVEKDMAPDHALAADVRAVGGEVRHFPSPRAQDLGRWIRVRAEAIGSPIEPAAAELLADLIGAQPVQLDSELHKLATYAGIEKRITPQMVDSLVGAVSQDSIFVLVDAIAGRNAAKALSMLQRQLESASSPIDFAIYLIRMLARQMRILLRIRLAQEAGRPHSAVIVALKLPRYYADRYFQQAGKLSTDRLRVSFERLAALEFALKSGKAEPGSALDLLVAELCR